ncbi:MAG TPA: ABC transporter permease [Hypericibacter adhaerens]|jgi:ABC-2 type transport system permease protein|uniref:Membrane protein n=1 Tax=Hypericibacter adhaerens TaxID=2602016 RepID=A0A5J6MYH4_9PROT|nr:ABC transporter permease [Hypericibacter adhaerens]QEX22822.1 membrane protein [Hypericibacter adhaerens]HWA44971.1 ABC transporter permease [Hypericibacter adhaerens]
MSADRRGRWRRIRGLVRKEMIQIWRDPSSLIVAFAHPLLLLFLFGFGLSFDANVIHIGLVLEQPSPETAWFETALSNSPYFDVKVALDRRDFIDPLTAGDIEGIVVVPADFAARGERGDTMPIQVITDGSDPNTASFVSGYLQGAWQVWQAQQMARSGGEMVAPVVTVPRFWFNPELKSRRALLPGSIAQILMMVGSLLTALIVAREWERGTMEALLATPIGRLEFIAGKLIPNFMLGMGAMTVSVILAVVVFDVPFRGSILSLVGVTAVFLLVALGLGLLVSSAVRTQFAASQIATLVSFLPSLFFSGAIFEISAMPAILRGFAAIVPARYYVDSLQTIFLVGDIAPVLLRSAAVLAVIATAIIAFTIRKTRMRLD